MKKFEYVYSAPTAKERKEIDGIRRQYVEDGRENKMARLRSLDRRVKNGATCAALIVGVLGCLIFGTGMAMVMEWNFLFWGIVVGVVGGGLTGVAMPVYKGVLKRNKKKYGKEILRLSEELLNERG